MADIENFFKNKKEEKKEEIKEEEKDPAKFSVLKTVLFSAGILAFLGTAGTSAFFYSKYKSTANKSGSTEAKSEAQLISEKIGTVMDLPGEEPTLATITDKEKLKGQAFFDNAQNGDKVLIYTKAQKAILWRPSVSKIIEVSSLVAQKEENKTTDDQPGENSSTPENTDINSQSDDTSVTENQTARIVVLNGTTIKGLAKSLGSKLSSVTGANVVNTGNAKRSDYARTLVIDLTGKNQSIAEKIAVELSGKVADFPESEEKPDADILVIGGTE